MYVRTVRFTDVSPERIEASLARINESDGPPPGISASRLQLLPVDNPHVKSDLAKIAKNKAPSPILLIRGDINTDVALQVADGYHRVCASDHTDENTDIPCRIA